MKTYVCEIYNHETKTVFDRGIDLEECAGSAYDKCMHDLSKCYHPMKYEFFCTEHTIDFQWSMTDEEFHNFKKYTEPDEDMDFCGVLFFGNFSLEFMHITDNVRYFNLFQLGTPGYDTLLDGTPYNERAEADEIKIPKSRTLESFQKAIEEEVLRVISENPDMIDDAVAETNPKKWYPHKDGTYFEPTITRRA